MSDDQNEPKTDRDEAQPTDVRGQPNEQDPDAKLMGRPNLQEPGSEVMGHETH